MRRGLIAVVALAALVLAGCGIPTDDEPRVLADEGAAAVNADADPAGSQNTASVYLVDDQSFLVASERALDGARSAATVLDALLAGQSTDEAARGLTSFIPVGTTQVSVTDVDGVVVVDLSEEWLSLGEPNISTAYAQVVFTLTDLPGVARVRFRVDGEDIQAQTPTQGPLDVVTAADYPALDPASASTTAPDG